ncbi:DUF4349 domain-containing protein [Paenibacillus pini]
MLRRGSKGLICMFITIAILLAMSGCGSSKNSTENSTESKAADSDGAPMMTEMLSSKDKGTHDTSEVAKAELGSKTNNSGKATDKALQKAEQTTAIGAGFNANQLSAGLNKKLIYKANVVMQIGDYASAQNEVRNLVTLSGGYIVNYTETQSANEQGGTFVMKVPADGFSSFLGKIEKIKHKTIQRSMEGQDVSEEYVDLESRLKAKQLMEEQYTAFMKKSTKTSDLVSFANELERIQTEIEQIKGRMRYIDQNVSFSTVELRLYQSEKDIKNTNEVTPEDPLSTRASNALQGSLTVLIDVLQWTVIILSGAVPVLIPIAIILIIVRLIRRSRRSRKEEAAERRRTLNQQSSPMVNRPELNQEEDTKDEQ